jgi:hypothetical protein
MLRIAGRIILIPLAILIAAIASGSFLVITGFVQPQIGGAVTEAAIATMRTLVESLMEDGEAIDRFGRLAKGLSVLTVSVLFLPLALIAAVAEVFSLRWWIIQALGVALLAALLPWAMMPTLMAGVPLGSSLTGILAAAGALGGSIYWLIAGRSAGAAPRSAEERATVAAPRIRKDAA